MWGKKIETHLRPRVQFLDPILRKIPGLLQQKNKNKEMAGCKITNFRGHAFLSISLQWQKTGQGRWQKSPEKWVVVLLCW
uniref:Uncharacterized protein n=1 Tax=Anguilla anguilla TaxID=7936 RepID=A0A0E9WBX9_ANGAN